MRKVVEMMLGISYFRIDAGSHVRYQLSNITPTF